MTAVVLALPEKIDSPTGSERFLISLSAQSWFTLFPMARRGSG